MVWDSQEVTLGNEKAEGKFEELWDHPQPASLSMVGLTRWCLQSV